MLLNLQNKQEMVTLSFKKKEKVCDEEMGAGNN